MRSLWRTAMRIPRAARAAVQNSAVAGRSRRFEKGAGSPDPRPEPRQAGLAHPRRVLNEVAVPGSAVTEPVMGLDDEASGRRGRLAVTLLQVVDDALIHLLAVRNLVDDVINPTFSLEVFNRTVKGLRAKTEVWCHTCWGNPSQQRMFKDVQSYKNALEMLNKVDADVVTFESASAGGMDLEAFGKIITNKKICIGVIDHHSLQVERPDEIAEHIRRALKHIPAERLVLSSDCGMGREGMSRRHAYYKIVSLVLGTNIVRKELGLPQAECLAADTRYSLVVPAK